MKIETREITQIVVSEAVHDGRRFQPITIAIEDISASAGSITITHQRDTWHAYWGSMGDRTLARFFVEADDTYIAGCLHPAPRSHEYDLKATRMAALAYIKERRGGREITPEEAQRLRSRVKRGMVDPMHEVELMNDVFGPDWVHFTATKITDNYSHFLGIIAVVQQALGQHFALVN